PAVRGLRAAVQEEQRRPAGGAPVEPVELEAVQVRGGVAGGGGGRGGRHGPARLARAGRRCPDLTGVGGLGIARRVIAVGDALARVCAAAPVLGPEGVPCPPPQTRRWTAGSCSTRISRASRRASASSRSRPPAPSSRHP